MPWSARTAWPRLRTSDAVAFRGIGGVPTSVANMSRGNPFIRAVATLPVVSDVPVHPIVCVKGDGLPEEGSDGVVRYSSAHQATAESAAVVRWARSCQGRPETVEEVRRILLVHLDRE